MDMYPHSSYCVDRFCWFPTVSLIHYTYLYDLIYQRLSSLNILSHIINLSQYCMAAVLQFILTFGSYPLLDLMPCMFRECDLWPSMYPEVPGHDVASGAVVPVHTCALSGQ